MTEELLSAVEINPEDEHRASVIWLHGLGADGHDFEPLVPELGLLEQGVRFVLPHAPKMPVTINGGMFMPAWYDIKSIDLERQVEEEHIERSRRQLEAWIAHERETGIPSDKIVLAGFSQGGVIALYTGLQHAESLAGILALSCYHPLPQVIRERGAAANRQVPIFMAHGTYDPVVPIALAEATAKTLRENGYAPEWHTYAIPHSVSGEEARDIAEWLKQRIGLD